MRKTRLLRRARTGETIPGTTTGTTTGPAAAGGAAATTRAAAEATKRRTTTTTTRCARRRRLWRNANARASLYPRTSGPSPRRRAFALPFWTGTSRSRAAANSGARSWRLCLICSRRFAIARSPIPRFCLSSASRCGATSVSASPASSRRRTRTRLCFPTRLSFSSRTSSPPPRSTRRRSPCSAPRCGSGRRPEEGERYEPRTASTGSSTIF
mmetsp:Transcript_2971/g.12249  ORF Transcript_2971/g.12249 Transcript_2971/m.12249 type:complete len:212 (-) Transcript_2971:1547-2182(-)